MNESEIKLSKIIDDSKTVDPKKVAAEVLDWIADNVAYFIDNKSRMFKLDLIIDDTKAEQFPETKKLQDLYHSIPDEKGIVDLSKVVNKDIDWTMDLTPEENRMLELHGNCRSELDKVTEAAYNAMLVDKERLLKVYDKMSFFYEMKGINKGKFLIQELDGAIGIMRFEYEAYAVPVEVVKKKMEQQENGSLVQKESEMLYKYVIPEGFSIWIEISLKTPTPSLF